MSSWGGEDRRSIFNGVVWTMTALSTVAVSLRVISRSAFGSNMLGLDDFISIVCVLVMFASGIAISVGTAAGVGQHTQVLTPDERVQAMKCVVIMNFFIVWAFSLPKFAIIALLRRILRLHKKVEYTFWAIALVNQSGILALSIYWFGRCRPASKGWDPSVEGICDSPAILGDLGYAFSVISAFLDLFFALYPIPAIMRLQMSLGKRIATSGSLALGSLACAVSIYKITTFPEVLAQLPVDPTYAVIPLVLFADVEANILILMACLATIGPLIRWASNKSPLSKGKSRQSNGNDRYGSWRSHKRLRLDDDTKVPDSGSGRNNEIPLVGTSSRAVGHSCRQAGDCPYGGIQKSIQVSVSFE